ncbi:MULTISPECIES: hypothetical protein [unclassified Kitasatospora]|uniref:hypothetical protein n=1 Tax=unclassified Kitasatospora TaxID=2633591 RepID=UPI003410C98A
MDKAFGSVGVSVLPGNLPFGRIACIARCCPLSGGTAINMLRRMVANLGGNGNLPD